MKRFIILSIVIALCCWGCYDIIINHKLSITNKSDVNISVLYSNRANEKLTENNVAYYIREDNVIAPGSSSDITTLGREDAWHNYIEEGKTKKLFFYIFNADSLKNFNNGNSMDELINQKKYSKLLEYTEKQLDEIHWKVTYK